MTTGMESPQSIYIDGYYKGFHIGVTKRDEEAKVKPLIDDAVAVIEHMISLGFEPSWNKQTSKEALAEEKPVKTNPTRSKVDKENCLHEHKMSKQSSGYSKPENKGRWYTACADCNAFLGWQKEQDEYPRPLSSYKPEEI